MFDNLTKIKLVYFFKSFYFFSPIIALFYISRGLDNFQIVALEAILIISVLLAEIPTGILADKIGRKESLVVMLLIMIISNVMIIYAQSYIMFAIPYALFGIGLAFESGAVEALVYDTLKYQKREKDMKKEWGSILSWSLYASVIAVLVGGFLARSHDPSTFVVLIWMFIIFASVGLIFALSIKERHHEKVMKKESPLVLFKESSGLILQSPELRQIIYLTIFTVPFVHTINFLFQPYFVMAGVQKSLFGVAMAIGILMSAYLTSKVYKIEEKLGKVVTMFIATILPGIFLILMALSVGPWLSFGWYILLKGLGGARLPLLAQYQNEHIPSHIRATALSVISIMVSLYLAIMRLVMGYIAKTHLLIAFGIMGSVVLVGAIVFRVREDTLQ